MDRTVAVRPLTDFGFAGVVDHADLRRCAAGSRATALVELLHRFGVLVLPAQALDPDALLEFAARLGAPESVRPVEHRLPGTEHVRLQSNLPGVGVNGGGSYWHSDGSWKPLPTAATILLCAAAPREGGTTTFVDGRAFYSELEPTLRERVDAEVGFYPCRQILRDELSMMAIADEPMVAAAADVRHPLVRVHPSTGARALILNEGWLRAESERAAALLAVLYERLNHSAHRYLHRWAEGDVLIWDNWVTMHRAAPVADDQSKVTWRVTIETWSPPSALAAALLGKE